MNCLLTKLFNNSFIVTGEHCVKEIQLTLTTVKHWSNISLVKSVTYILVQVLWLGN